MTGSLQIRLTSCGADFLYAWVHPWISPFALLVRLQCLAFLLRHHHRHHHHHFELLHHHSENGKFDRWAWVTKLQRNNQDVTQNASSEAQSTNHFGKAVLQPEWLREEGIWGWGEETSMDSSQHHLPPSKQATHPISHPICINHIPSFTYGCRKELISWPTAVPEGSSCMGTTSHFHSHKVTSTERQHLGLTLRSW